MTANSTTNSSVSSPKPHPQLMAINFASRGDTAMVLETVFVVCFVIVGFLGNFIVCVVILRNKDLCRRATNLAVMGLALSDISLFIFGGPFLIATILKGRWIFTKQLCDFEGITLFALSAISLYLMALIAVNRFFCVVKPSCYKSIFNSKTTILYAFTIWSGVTSIFLSFYFVGWLHVYFHPYKAICVPYFNLKTEGETFSAYVGSGFVMVAQPVLVLSFCYIRIFINIRQHHTRVTTAHVNQGLRSVNLPRVRELRMTRIMFAVVLGFFVCWLPVYVIDVVANSGHSWVSMSRYAALVPTYLVLLSSTLNPWIISVMNRTFRKEILKILKCKLSRLSPDCEVTQTQARVIAFAHSQKTSMLPSTRQTHNS